MKKMIWLTTMSVLFLVFIVPGILASTLKMIPAGDQPGYNSDQRISIYGTRGLSQKFISKEKNLVAIGTSIRNPNLKNKKEILFNLYDDNGVLIRTSLLNGLNIQDGAFVKFVFEPVIDSLNKTYTFTIFSPEAGPEETIEAFYINKPTDSIIEFTYDKKIHLGGIPLVTFHRPASKWEVIKKMYSSLFSRLQFLDS